MSEKITVALIVFGGVIVTQAVGYLIARQAANDLGANIDREIDIIRKLRPGTTEVTSLEAHVKASIAKLIYRDKRRQQLTDLIAESAPPLITIALAVGIQAWQQHGIPDLLRVPVNIATYTLFAVTVLFSVRYLWDLLKYVSLYTRTGLSFARFVKARVRLWWMQRKTTNLKMQATESRAIVEHFLDVLEEATEDDDNFDADQFRTTYRNAKDDALQQLAALGVQMPTHEVRHF
jgi:hypothetical protein